MYKLSIIPTIFLRKINICYMPRGAVLLGSGTDNCGSRWNRIFWHTGNVHPLRPKSSAPVDAKPPAHQRPRKYILLLGLGAVQGRTMQLQWSSSCRSRYPQIWRAVAAGKYDIQRLWAVHGKCGGCESLNRIYLSLHESISGHCGRLVLPQNFLLWVAMMM